MAEKNIRLRTLKRGDHAGNGVVEGGMAIEVGLPEFLQQLEVLVPTTLIEALAQGVGSVAAARDASILVAGGRIRGAEHWPEHFTGGVEHQGVPEIARDGLVALRAFTNDGGFHGLGEAWRNFGKQNFASRGAPLTTGHTRYCDA